MSVRAEKGRGNLIRLEEGRLDTEPRGYSGTGRVVKQLSIAPRGLKEASVSPSYSDVGVPLPSGRGVGVNTAETGKAILLLKRLLNLSTRRSVERR